MSRPASGKEVLAKAQEVVANARTVEELRQAQSVILPLKFGFSMEEVASVTGISKGWACQLRTRFIRSGGKSSVAERKRGGRRRENMDKGEEAAFLAPFLIKLPKVASWWRERSSGRLMTTWAARFRYPRSTICCIATIGENLLLTRGTRRLMPRRRQNGKKIPGTPLPDR